LERQETPQETPLSNRTISLNDELYDYLLKVSLREPDLLRRLREETAALPQRSMQIAPEQGQFMAMLVRLMSAKRILEIGTFTGYSALCMALALPPHGRIVACDMSREWTAVAWRYWAEAMVEDRITLRLGPAMATLEALLAAGEGGRFDIAFIDADKENYSGYFEHALALVRAGGLIMVDNVLWGGSVINSAKQDPDTVAIRDFNTKIRNDQRVHLSLVPIGDGLTLAMKRA
jgi:caffeoyl-CoA O-methyltransferase